MVKASMQRFYAKSLRLVEAQKNNGWKAIFAKRNGVFSSKSKYNKSTAYFYKEKLLVTFMNLKTQQQTTRFIWNVIEH